MEGGTAVQTTQKHEEEEVGDIRVAGEDTRGPRMLQVVEVVGSCFA